MTKGDGANAVDPASISHFRILGRLGEGGMGVVYRAEDERLHREVALKVLPVSLAADPERRRRFLREARAAAAVTHPNIAAVHDVGEADGHVFIAMELVRGDTLRARMQPGLTHAEALRIAREVAKGLARAHETGVVHRDLKPENVMVNPDGDVKILDFGLAKLVDLDRDPTAGATSSEATAAGRILGTPPYMSPEQAEGRTEVDARSDVFSFGVMLYEMLAGVRPFTGTTSIAVLYGVLHREPEPLEAVCPGVSSVLAAVVARCLKKPTAERFASGRELLAALGTDSAPLAAHGSSGQAPAAGRLATVSGMGMALEATATPDGPLGQLGAARPERALAPAPTTGSRAAAAPTASAEAVRPQGERRWRGLVALGAGLIAAATAAAASWGMARHEGASAAAPSAAASASASAARSPAPLATGAYAERRLTWTGGESAIADAWLTPDARSVVYTDEAGSWTQALPGGGSGDGPRSRIGITGVPASDGYGFTPLADGRRALVVATKGDVLQAWLAPLDGGAARLVHEGHDSGAWISPDGTRLAILRPDQRSIGVTPTEGGPAVQIAVPGVATAVAFSPDGSHLAMLTADPVAIVIASADGRNVTQTYSDPALARGRYTERFVALAWPEPGRLLFTRRSPEPGVWSLRTIGVDHDGHAVTPARDLWQTRVGSITGVSAANGRMAVVIAQHHTSVRFADLAPGGRRILGRTRDLPRSEGLDGAIIWLIDGRLAFLSNRGNEHAVYAQALDSETPTLLIAPPVDENRVRSLWSLRTGEVVYGRPDPDAGPGASRIVVARPGGAERELLRVSGDVFGAGVACTWNEPTRCIVARDYGGRATIAVLDVGEGKVGEPFFSQPLDVSDGDLMPGGASGVVATGSNTLTFMDIATGRTRSITPTPTARQFSSAAFTRDGKTVIVAGSGFTGVNHGLIAADLDGHGAMLLTSNTEELSRVRVSPDGKTLAFTAESDAPDVWILEPRTE